MEVFMDIVGGEQKKWRRLRKEYTGKSIQEWEEGLNKLIQNHPEFKTDGGVLSVNVEGDEIIVTVKQNPYFIINPKKDTFIQVHSKDTKVLSKGQSILNKIYTTVTDPTIADQTPEGEFEESVLINRSLRYL
jgi:hypothetical protein